MALSIRLVSASVTSSASHGPLVPCPLQRQRDAALPGAGAGLGNGGLSAVASATGAGLRRAGAVPA